MPNTIAPAFPFDPTGLLVSNLVTNEQQILTAANGANFHIAIPTNGPYFKESLIITITDIRGNIRTLVDGIDYIPTHWFISASRACAKQIYGSISFLDLNLAGIIKLQYQTIGGPWTVDSAQIASILSDYIRNPRITGWEEVSGSPTIFPPIPHQWNLVDMVGMSSLVAEIVNVETAIRNRPLPAVITAAQLGVYTVAQVDALFASESLAETLGTTNTALTAEIAARTAADVVEATARNIEVSAESNARYDADAVEIAARIAGDSTNHTAIIAEVARAQAAEAALQTAINGTGTGGGSVPTLVSAFTNDVGYQTVSQVDAIVATEAAARQIEINTLQGEITTEVTARTTGDNTLTTNLATETSARIAGDSTNVVAIAAEVTRAQGIEAALSSSINTKDMRAQSAESTIAVNLNTEINARVAAETILQTELTAETTQRQAVDAALQGNINLEASARVATDTSLQAQINALSVSALGGIGSYMSGYIAYPTVGSGSITSGATVGLPAGSWRIQGALMFVPPSGCSGGYYYCLCQRVA
jgi:hypothetical protein